MALRLKTAPTVEPVTLAEARKHLRLDAPTLTDELTPAYSITPASYGAGETTGSGVDVLGYSVLVVLQAGTCAGTLDVHLEESDDDVTYTDVTGGAFAQVTVTNDNATYTKEYAGGKRYVRAVGEVADAACVYGVTVIKKGGADAEDTLIEGLITAARQMCESITNRAFVTQTWTLYLEDWPEDDWLKLPKGNLQSVESVKYTDSAGTVQTLVEDTDYLVDTYSEPGRIVLAYGESWPTESLYPANPIAIEFTCGYGDADDVPKAIKQALLLLVGHWYEHREAVLVGAASKEIEFAVRALLAPYVLFGAEW